MEKLTKELIKKSFGKHLKSVRHEFSLSQEELAFRAGMDPTYISGIERGKKNPTVTSIYQIAIALKVSPQSLLPEIDRQWEGEKSDD
ncbi:helix-turn-helix domain-containing protein [Halobacillus litoralis]|uniref:XRE family transcriptional regulator n=1 Tax=Halobacillus litoralis TaxID=45668 RepID=A0A410MFK9_9BACI|nr:helix-turn-helix transcriptional regulator [Halobacillus litoralis]QAS53455.1 XRE family transcriptional regulator [Halobacillus litoralis]